MSFKQLILTAVTLMAIAVFGYSLISSWQEPQVQSQIELYQTDLILQASELQSLHDSDPNAGANLPGVWSPVLGQNPVKDSLEQYQAAQKETQKNLEVLRSNLKATELRSNVRATKEDKTAGTVLKNSIQQLETSLAELTLKLGILQATQVNPETAQKTWQTLVQTDSQETVSSTALVLIGLWSQPPRILPIAEEQLQTGLKGWFRYRALSELYRLQQRFDTVAQLQNQAQLQAQTAAKKLFFVAILPAIGMVLGIGLLIGLFIQRLRKGQVAWLAEPETLWTTPWTGETVWQVLIVNFFVLGQIAIPILFSILGWRANAANPRSYGFVILGNYLCFALGGFGVLWLSIRSFLPLASDWFRLQWREKWFLWGIGGYLVAVPLVVVVSLANQQLWQGRGGSNPLLPIALNGQDHIALLCFYITAAVIAPIFEEVMFRGFLLPSLTRYLPLNGAIVVSSFLFAIAHLSLSEVLPLMVLGMILGWVYTRSRNLLSPMLLHSLWNSGTLITLFILGSGGEAPISG